MQASAARHLRSVCALAERMGHDGAGFEILVTGAGLRDEATRLGLRWCDLPRGRSDTAAFLDLWAPDLLIWGDGDLSPLVLSEAQRREIPSLLLEAGLRGRLPDAGWRPGRLRQRLAGFTRVLAASGPAAARLTRQGLPPDRVEALGRFDDYPPPPGVDPGEMAQMAEAIGPRPLWLAAQVPQAEIGAVLDAHRHASRRSPRLLLVLAPDAPDDPAIEAALADSHLRVARRGAGEDPEELHQVLLADVSGELGLWLRLAPVTYLGGSLSGGGGLAPMAVAALGSALIHGREGRDQLRDDLAVLSRAGASVPIAGPGALPGAVEQLLPPDQAARLAHEAWVLASAGAQALNRMAELVQDAQDGALR